MVKDKENRLRLIPKVEKYMEYILLVIEKMPRTEKFNIGNEYKQSMYKMLRNTMFINKIDNKIECLKIVNEIDAELNTQRIFLRIMYKNRWIDAKKFEVSMNLIYEIGKVIGGLIKYYAKDN